MKKLLSLIFTAILCVAMVATFTSCTETSGGESSSKNEDKVKLIDVKLTDEEYAFVMKKGNTALQTAMNDFMAEIKGNGVFDGLVAKYFKGEGTPTGYTLDDNSTENSDANLVVVTNCQFEPFEYIGDDGKIYGLDIEIAAAFAQKQGLTLVVKNIAFDAIFEQVDAGYADVGMAGITVSADRVELYDFSTAYYKASQKLIVSADNTDFDACKTAEEVEAVLAGLSGKSIGYQNGTTGGMYINGDEDWGYDGFANITGKGYSTAQMAVADLVNGNLYAVVVDEAPANAIVSAVNA